MESASVVAYARGKQIQKSKQKTSKSFLNQI